MKQTSPELDIPEGVFYDEIEGYNIYVKNMIVMKTVFARVITALVMIAGFTSCIWAGSKGEHVTNRIRKSRSEV